MAVAERNGISAVVNEVADHARTLVRLEGELAAIELRRKAASFGAGAALLGGAIVLVLFALGFLLATAASALGTFLPGWASLLIVAGALSVIAVIAAAIGTKLLRRATPPVPEQAVAEARATTQALKGSNVG